MCNITQLDYQKFPSNKTSDRCALQKRHLGLNFMKQRECIANAQVEFTWLVIAVSYGTAEKCRVI